MRLVESSNPGDVDRDTAIHLLAQRAVLTRAVCRELSESSRGYADRRACVALSFLLRWIQENQPESFRFLSAAGTMGEREPRASDGIEDMVVPAGYEDLRSEIRSGARVGDALCMLMTADNPTQARGDEDEIRNGLASYWASHGTPVRAPMPIECWSGFPTRRADPGAAAAGGRDGGSS